MKNSLIDLRTHLFEVIERLKSNDDPTASPEDKISLDNAKMIVSAANSIIATSKAEFEGLKLISDMGNFTTLNEYAKNNPLGLERRNG